MARVRIDASDWNRKSRRLRRVLEELKGIEPYLYGAMKKYWGEKFYKSGPNWQPISGQTMRKRKNNIMGFNFPLIDTGVMMNSFVARNRYSVRERYGNQFRIGSSHPHAQEHDLGEGYATTTGEIRKQLLGKKARRTRIKTHPIPQRELLNESDAQLVAYIEDYVNQWINEAIEVSFGNRVPLSKQVSRVFTWPRAGGSEDVV